MQDPEAVKTYQKLSEVLTYVQVAHDRVHRACEAAGERIAGDPPQVLLMSFAGLQAQQAKTLHTAMAEQPPEFSETWIQYIPTREVDALLDRIERIGELTWRDVADLALRIQAAVTALFEQVLDQAAAEPVREILADLANDEREHAKKLSKKLLSLQEM